jgi:DNA-directed RNA polymerase specialized sigma24 family protein
VPNRSNPTTDPTRPPRHGPWADREWKPDEGRWRVFLNAAGLAEFDRVVARFGGRPLACLKNTRHHGLYVRATRPGRAEEAGQAALVGVLHHVRLYDPARSPCPTACLRQWVRTEVATALYGRTRRDATGRWTRTARPTERLAADPPAAGGWEAEVDGRLDAAALLAALPPGRAAAVRLAFLEGRTYAEAGKNRVKNGVAQLKKLVGSTAPNPRSRRVFARDLRTGEVRCYATIADVEADGFLRSSVSDACRGAKKSHRDFQFWYEQSSH